MHAQLQLINNACTTPTDQQCMNSQTQLAYVNYHTTHTNQLTQILVLFRNSSNEMKGQNRSEEERAPRMEAKAYEERI